MKPSAPFCHAVLLYKMDAQNFYLKNTNPAEPEIVIPKCRATYYQNHIFDKRHQFTPKQTTGAIGKLFKNIIPTLTRAAWDEWFFIDYGYLLKLTKKGDANIATDEINQAAADLEKLLNDTQKSSLKILTTKVQKHNDANKKEIENQKKEVENQKQEVENQKQEVENRKKEVENKDREIEILKGEIADKNKKLEKVKDLYNDLFG